MVKLLALSLGESELYNSSPMDVTYFASQAHFRRWLAQHHATEAELWVGFYKVGSGRGGITYKQALDEALCFGWIDGVRKRLDEDSFTQRFSPRTPTSNWSAVNIRRMGELDKLGVIHSAGRRAFETRDQKRTNTYSYENRPMQFDGEYEQLLKANAKAWAFYHALPPSARRTCTWFVLSAVKAETQRKRLDTLIKGLAEGRRMDLLGAPLASSIVKKTSTKKATTKTATTNKAKTAKKR
jgi:uncharacterized protein YdeI (YjbR/CyaY-like superfamily)